MKVIANKCIDDDLLAELVKLEKEVFDESGTSLGEDFFRECHAERTAGLFALVDEANAPIGFMDAIFLDDEQAKQYINGGEARKLKNIDGAVGEDNNLLLMSLAVKKAHRGSDAAKILMQSFCEWLHDINQQGVKMKFIFAEAVSPEGATSLSEKMGMLPIGEVNEKGLGFYYSPDNLKEYVAATLTRQSLLGKPKDSRVI